MTTQALYKHHGPQAAARRLSRLSERFSTGTVVAKNTKGTWVVRTGDGKETYLSKWKDR